MIDTEFARAFAEDWIDSWNAHDLERILSHYSDTFAMASPVIPALVGEPSGILAGKAAVGAYWAKALERRPDLRFELVAVYAGVETVAVEYDGPRGRGVEVFTFDDRRAIIRGAAHYAVP